MLIAYAVAVTCFAMFQSVVIWGMTLVWRDQERKIKALKDERDAGCTKSGSHIFHSVRN